MEFLNEIFDKREKPIGENSRKLYIHNLMKLNNGEPIINLDFLKDINAVLSKLAKYKPTTIRSYIIAICTVLKNNNEKLYNQYYEILSKMNNDLKVNTEKSDKQKENWMDNNDILELFMKLKEEAKTRGKDKYDNVLRYLILALYVIQSPRRNIDYTLMKISNDMSDNQYNYLDLVNRQFIFNNYKTAGKYNQVLVPIEDELFKVIKLYLSVHPEKSKLKNKNYSFHFLISKNGTPIDKSSSMTKIMNKIFGGKKIGSSLLRNIYLTNKYSGVMEQLNQDVADMGTSVSNAMNQYIKTSNS
jgi:hypothetical protein